MLSQDEARTPLVRDPYPYPDMILIAGGIAFPDGLLSLTVDGKTKHYNLTRKQMFGLAEQVMGALKRMEPGK